MNEDLLQLAYSKFETDADYETFKADLLANEDLQRMAYDKFETDADFETFKVDLFGEKKNQVETDTVSELEGGSLGLSDAQKAELGIPYGEGVDDFGVPTYQEEPEEDRIAREDKNKNFWGASVMGGMSRLNEAITSIPNTLYDMAAYPQNKLSDALDLPEDHWLRTDSGKFEETIGVKNSILDYYQEETKKYGERKQKYVEENYESGSIYEEVKKGNYSDAFDLLGSGMLESTPISLGIMASGGAFGLARTALGTTVALTEGQKSELRQAFPEATEAELMEKAVMSAAAESVFSAIGTGTIGSVYKDILKKEGTKAGQEIFKKGLIEMYKKAIKKYGAPVAALGEGLEEVATQITQNLIAGRNPFEGVADAFILGVASGGTMAAPINLMQATQKTQTPEDGTVELNIPAMTEEAKLQKEQAGVYAVPDSEVKVVKVGSNKWEIQDSTGEKDGEMLYEAKTLAEAENWLKNNSPDTQEVTTPENVVEETEQAVEPDIEPTDDVEPVQQGLFPERERRDSNLSVEGAVRDAKRKLKKTARFLRKTFSSTQGLDQDVIRTSERHHGRTAATNKTLQTDQVIFSKIIKTTKKRFKNTPDFNQGLRQIDAFLKGQQVDVDFLSDSEMAELDQFRKNIDEKSGELNQHLQKELTKLDDAMEIEKGRIRQQQDAETAAADPLGLEFPVEYKYESPLHNAMTKKKEGMEALMSTIEGNKGAYMFRSYDAFSDPEYIDALTSKTPNKAAKKRMAGAVEFVMEETGVDAETAEAQLLTYLDGIRNKENFLAARMDGKIEAPFLKRRKDIPQPIRTLLGESLDPVRNYTSSIFNISNYISSIKYQQELGVTLKELGISSDKMQRGYTLFKTNNQGWDFLEDTYVPIEFAEAMEDIKNLDPINTDWAKWMVNAAGITKLGKTVLSPITTARNFWSGSFLSLNAGFIPFSNNTLESFQHSWGGIKTRHELKEENLKLLELGVIGDGALSGEILNVMNDMKSPVDRMMNKTAFDKAMTAMQKIYAMGDDAYKVMGFYQYKSRYMKAGETEANAEELAARRIRNGFPTYSKIPKNMKALRRIPLVGTFPSFSFEVWRTTKNNLEFIYKDLKAYKETGNKVYRDMAVKQILGMGVAGAISTALVSLSKSAVGVGDEEEEASKNMSPEWQKDSALIYIRKDDGTLEFIDATAFFPQETIIKPLRILLENREGRTLEDKLRLSLSNIANPFLGTDILAGTMMQLAMNKSSYGQEIYRGENLLEGLGNDPTKIADYFLSNAGVGFYNNIKEFARANEVMPEVFGEKESRYKEYTNTEAILALAGFRLSKVDYTQGTTNLALNARTDFVNVRNEAVRDIKSSVSLDDATIGAIVDKEDAINKELYADALIAVQGYKNLGSPQKRLFDALRNRNFTQKDIAAMFVGIEPPLKQVGKSTLKTKREDLKLGRLRNEKEKLSKQLGELDRKALIFNDKTAIKNMENVAQHLYETFGNRLAEGKLSKDELEVFNFMKARGLLLEVANKEFGEKNRKVYNSRDFYNKLVTE